MRHNEHDLFEITKSGDDLFATPWTAAHQAPLSVGFSRQEYWSQVPLPSPENKNRIILMSSPSFISKDMYISKFMNVGVWTTV